MAARDDRGMRATGERGGLKKREGEAGQSPGDGGKDREESFNCPIGSECNR